MYVSNIAITLTVNVTVIVAATAVVVVIFCMFAVLNAVMKMTGVFKDHTATEL
jgi:hypothetical protein